MPRIDPAITKPAAESLRTLAAALEDESKKFDDAATRRLARELGVPSGPDLRKRLAKVLRALADKVHKTWMADDCFRRS